MLINFFIEIFTIDLTLLGKSTSSHFRKVFHEKPDILMTFKGLCSDDNN